MVVTGRSLEVSFKCTRKNKTVRNKTQKNKKVQKKQEEKKEIVASQVQILAEGV